MPTVFGTVMVNGLQTPYRIDVEDNAEPGIAQNRFLIQTGSGYIAGGFLTRGNVQVHR